MAKFNIGDEVRYDSKGMWPNLDGLEGIVTTLTPNRLVRFRITKPRSGYLVGTTVSLPESRVELLMQPFGINFFSQGGAGEVRTTSTTGAEKGVKPERFDLIPVEALAVVAQLYGKGAEKYAAHNWRKGYEWSKSYAALQRHSNAFWQGEDIDPEMQLPHMAAVVFHALALITFMQEQPGFDDRFKSKEVTK